jgi:hypothetical protein
MLWQNVGKKSERLWWKIYSANCSKYVGMSTAAMRKTKRHLDCDWRFYALCLSLQFVHTKAVHIRFFFQACSEF